MTETRRTPRRRRTHAAAAALVVALIGAACGAPAAAPETSADGAAAAPEAAAEGGSEAAAAGDGTAEQSDAAPAPAPAPEGGGTGDLAFPAEPVQLNVIDVAGNLQLTQGMIEAYAAENPDKVAGVNFETAAAPDLAGRIQSQQEGGDLQTDLVLTGTDGLSAGIEFDLWEPLEERYASTGADLAEILLEPAFNMQSLAEGYGVVVTYYPSGPLLEYDPAQVESPPATPEDLLAYAEANPGMFTYARPSNSGPGRTFLMGLPYLLDDSDPQDPENGWENTWAFLEELGQHIDYYPSGTTQTMTELGQGARSMVATTTGWDINPRALGTVPAEVEVAAFDDFTWVSDAHYFVVPAGVDDGTMAVLLDLLAWMHTPEENAKAYDNGYFYPGPAVEGATLDLAPAESQAVIEQFGREDYDALIADNPVELPLEAADLVTAFERWDREIGGNKVQEDS